jgi:hypothetical protein
MKTDIRFWSYVHIFWEWEMFQTKVVGETKTHFVFSNLFPENRAFFFKIMWKNIAERGRSQMTIWRTRIACRIRKLHTHTHNTQIAFPLQQWLQERASILRYPHIICLVHSKNSWSRYHKRVSLFMYSTRHYCQILMKTWIFSAFSKKKYSNVKFKRKSFQWGPSYYSMRDEQT